MLYEFKSKATGSVVMTGPVAERLLALVGKDAGPQGIFTVEQMPGAIAALQAAVERDRAEPPADDSPDARPPGTPPAVGLAQRAWPLIDMLQAAHRQNEPITWGV
jgi:hypothetical protein